MSEVPSQQAMEVMKKHLENFESYRFDEDVEENASPSIKGVTPLSDFMGPLELKQFYDIFRDYLPKASICIKSVEYHTDKLVYHWQASSPTALVQDGKCTLLIKDNKIINQNIECEVEPFVQNMG